MDKSSLLKKDYRDLYKLYDSSKDDLEKQLIKEVVDTKAIHEKDIDYQAYPDYHNKDFQKIIYEKKEFNVNKLFLDTAGIEDACNSEFSIKPHQSFLKNFMTKESPYKSLLIFHGVGVGKTCSGLTIAENFRDPYARKEKRVLILSSKNIQLGWKKNIYDPDKEENQCTGESFIHSGAKTNREVNKLVKQYYELMAYQSFSNFVKRLIKNYVQRYPKDEREEKEIECIQQYFSNRYMIIDEVHNIRDDQGSETRDTIKTIEKVIKYSHNLRLVLLTATPMYNRSTEIIWILNMMLLNDNRPIIDKKDVFDINGVLHDIGKGIIKDKCRGYISYLRGENPITFPIRLYPRQLKDKQKKYVYPTYSKDKQISIINRLNNPSLNLVGGKILKKDKFWFLELFGSLLHGLQYKIYKKSIDNLINKNPDIDLDIRGELTPIRDNMMLIQLNNMVYPSDKNIDDDDIRIEEFYGERGINNCMNRHGPKYAYKKNVLDTYGPIFDKDKLSNYSSKIKSILDVVTHSEGIVFIYTAYIHSGIIPLQLALEQNGYKRHTGDGILKYPEWSSVAEKGTTKREPRSFDGRKKSQVSDNFQQAKYMVIDGSTPKNILQHQLNIVNSKENMNGEKIKIILGTVVASEGLDFKRLRNVHILDPWLHLNRIEQTVGRAIRFCSHGDLPDTEKNVLIYLHTSTLPNGYESIDTSIYRYAEKKSIQIGSVEMILKESAVDRFLYKDVNVIKKGTLQYVKMNPPDHSSTPIEVDPGDTPYSKVCSYSAGCDYNHGLKIDEDILPNTDTFIEQYSSNVILNIKQKISLLYKENYVYDTSSILGLLNEYGYNVDDMIYSALNEMLLYKFMVYDKYGNSGYLINKHIYYIFQPYLVDDESIPMYYRMNLLHIPKQTLMLPGLNEVVDECNCSKTYEVPRIKAVYDKIQGMQNEYDSDKDEPNVSDVLDLLTSVHTDIDNNHIIMIAYWFDRLDFEDKCKLMYGYLLEHKDPIDGLSEIHTYPFYDNLKEILSSFIIYNSTKPNTYNINDNTITKKDIFGFVLSYNSKPCFFEYIYDEIIPCNQYKLIHLKSSLKEYITTKHYKEFIATDNVWGYTHIRTKKYNKECVLKLVQPNSKGKTESTNYPDGVGNVSIDNNLFSKREMLVAAIKNYHPEFSADILKRLKDKTLVKKKDLCLLLELILRYKDTSFYPYDKIWLKYY